MTIYDVICIVEKAALESIANKEFLENIRCNKPTMSKSDKRILSKRLINFRELGKVAILKYILIYSCWYPDEAIHIARQKGVFRYKAWGFKNNSVEFLLMFLQKNSGLFNFSEKTQLFINTKLKLSWMYDFYKDSEQELIKFIREHHNNRRRIKIGNNIIEEALFKELLAYIDTSFNFHNHRINEHQNKNQFNCYSIEEISESISYIIYLYDSTIGINNNNNYWVSPKFVLSDEIEKIILIGCKVHQLQEWELCIDYFNYQVKFVDNKYLIYDEEQIFEKSIRLGYVKRDMQEDLFYMQNDSFDDALSLIEVSKYVKNKLGNQLLKNIGTGPLSRFRFEFPEPLFKPFFQSNSLFKEEILSLQHCAKEFITTPDEVLSKQITTNCTLSDVILFQRFFTILFNVAESILFEQDDKYKIVRSLIPAFPKETLIKLLSSFLGKEEKAYELLELFTYKKAYKLDLQYTPFLKVLKNLLFPTALVSRSNLLRNCIAYSYLSKNQKVNEENRESLVVNCANIFKTNQFECEVFTNKNFSYKNQDGEIDVLVISDKDIIII